MPRYTVKFGHYLILEATVALEAPDRSSVIPSWHRVSHNVEVETIHEEKA